MGVFASSDTLTGEVGGVDSYSHGELALIGLELLNCLELNGDEAGGDELGMSRSSYMLGFKRGQWKYTGDVEDSYRNIIWNTRRPRRRNFLFRVFICSRADFWREVNTRTVFARQRHQMRRNKRRRFNTRRIQHFRS
jgi:hypothetical protein